MRLLWATRGRTWGFRFLRRGGLVDPLPEFSSAFANLDGARQTWNHVATTTALRFQDPNGRTDRAGRIIPHEFVIFDGAGKEINSVEAGIELVWPLFEDEYARDYELPEPVVRER
ncbi:hypothetical protein ITJ64_11690 [Herbiconiux sp. VKM Ac-1786]|nr:hypothetical protein [Herbiconiux sp. VKM Ac-1786]